MAKCKVCLKAVYPMDPQINLDGNILHKQCAKCEDCKCQITLSNFTKNVSSEKFVLLCKVHYFKRFREGGSYLGADNFAKKAPRDIHAGSKTGGVDSSSQDAGDAHNEPAVVVPKKEVEVVKPVLKPVPTPAARAPLPVPEPVPVVVAAPEPVVVAEPEPEVVAVPEPVVVAEPEPVVVSEPEPEPTPVAEPEAESVVVAEPEPVVEEEAAPVAVEEEALPEPPAAVEEESAAEPPAAVEEETAATTTEENDA